MRRWARALGAEAALLVGMVGLSGFDGPSPVLAQTDTTAPTVGGLRQGGRKTLRVTVYARVRFLLIAASVVLLMLSRPVLAQSGGEPPAASPNAVTYDSVAVINPEWPAIRGDLVWEATMTVGRNGGFLNDGGHRDGSITDNDFTWQGTDYTVTRIYFVHPELDPDSTTVSIYFEPELPDDSSGLRLEIEESGLNLVDGSGDNGHFIWHDIDLNWDVGEPVSIRLEEFPLHIEPRSMDGRANNLSHPTWGMAGTSLLKKAPVSYTDGVSAPTKTRPNPRTVSNLVLSQDESVPNSSQASDITWQWGQFIDHDITLSPDNLEEPFPVPVPRWDPVFDPSGTGQATIHLDRSAFDPETGTDPRNPRRQINVVTAFIDGSQVYGSDTARAHALRANDDTGRLKTSHEGRFLPYNEQGLDNEGGSHLRSLFVAGDVRVNEQIGLISMHTLFVREHNRLAEIIADQNPGLNGDEIYQLARKVVGAKIQAITFNEFLPLLLGPDTIGSYSGYDPSVDPTIASEFSAAAYRVGHTLLSPSLLLLGADGDTGKVSLADAFFDPSFFSHHGISEVLRGLAAQQAQEVDSLVINEVRNLLLRQPHGPTFDLTALNIQRGRDHGVGDYNTVRNAYGLPPTESFADISSKPSVQRALEAAYGDVHNLDLWPAALAEDHVPGAAVGETLQAIISEQFRRLRDGDRHWFENDPYFLANPELLNQARSTTLTNVIRGNSPIEGEIDDSAFVVGDAEPQRASDLFDDVPAEAWYEPAITWMANNDITQGCAVRQFCPHQDLSRQQFVTFLWRAAGEPTAPHPGSVAFADVQEGAYSDEAIGWAVSEDVIEGCTPGTLGDQDRNFCPLQPVSRGQMATFLVRALELEVPPQPAGFDDVDPAGAHAANIEALFAAQITTGCARDPLAYCPDRSVTRAQMAAFLHRAFNPATRANSG